MIYKYMILKYVWCFKIICIIPKKKSVLKKILNCFWHFKNNGTITNKKPFDITLKNKVTNIVPWKSLNFHLSMKFFESPSVLESRWKSIKTLKGFWLYFYFFILFPFFVYFSNFSNIFYILNFNPNPDPKPFPEQFYFYL